MSEEKIVPRETLLSNATNEELFTEFMERVIGIAGAKNCFFIDSLDISRTSYGIHHAGNDDKVPAHHNFLTTIKE